MSRYLSCCRILSVGALGAVLSLACSGESTNSDDDSDGGSGGTAGSQGGSTSKGGTGGTTMPDGMCDDITACGGDPTGTWTVRENCTEVLLPVFPDTPGCENVIGAGTVELEGTFTFQDGVATQETSTTVVVTTTIDDACAQALAELPEVTADQLCPLINLQFMMNPDTPGTCAVASGGCRCEATQMEPAMAMTDTYTVVGSQIVLGSSTAYDFCRDGDELHLHGDAADPATSATGEATLLLELVP